MPMLVAKPLEVILNVFVTRDLLELGKSVDQNHVRPDMSTLKTKDLTRKILAKMLTNVPVKVINGYKTKAPA